MLSVNRHERGACSGSGNHRPTGGRASGLKSGKEFGEATIQPQDQDTFIATLYRRPNLKDPMKQHRREEVIEQRRLF